MPQKEQGLLGPLKYTKEQTGDIDGLRIPLGTTDSDEAHARLHRSRDRFRDLVGATQPGQLGIVVVKKNGLPTHIKYRLGNTAEREMKRIPAELASQLASAESAARFCLAWYAVHSEFAPVKPLEREPEALTWNVVAQRWFNGELHKRYPEYVKAKRSARDDEVRYNKYLAPVIGHRSVAGFTGNIVQDACDQILERTRDNGAGLKPATQRQILQVFSRLLSLAVFPLRVLPRNDLPRERMPKLGNKMAFSYIFPEEDERLMRCKKVPLHHRLFLGILAREGLRASELRDLEWSNLDLDRGLLTLEENKTDSPRTWTLDRGVVEALRRWVSVLSPKARQAKYVVVDRMSGRRIAGGKAAAQLKAGLAKAKVEREALFTSSASRMAIRGHDLRATFVTMALAAGKTEAWVTDRTGHTSSTMLYRYKRAARTHAEAQMGSLRPLHEAIPELSEAPALRVSKA